MKQLKTALSLSVAVVLLVGCNQQADKPSAATPAAPANPGVAAQAPGTEMARQFAPLENASPAGAVEVACALDQINAQLAASQIISIESGSEARFIGWISDPAKQVPGQFKIVLTGEQSYGVEAVAGVARPDVATALKAEALGNAGFNVLATLTDIPAGEYKVSLLQDAGGQIARCNTAGRVTVVKSPA